MTRREMRPAGKVMASSPGMFRCILKDGEIATSEGSSEMPLSSYSLSCPINRSRLSGQKNLACIRHPKKNFEGNNYISGNFFKKVSMTAPIVDCNRRRPDKDAHSRAIRSVTIKRIRQSAWKDNWSDRLVLPFKHGENSRQRQLTVTGI